MNKLIFGVALESMKGGSKVARLGWNGKGMWLVLVDALMWTYHGDGPIMSEDQLPWIGMRTADGKFVPWLASQTDVLAEDWIILKD